MFDERINIEIQDKPEPYPVIVLEVLVHHESAFAHNVRHVGQNLSYSLVLFICQRLQCLQSAAM